jgi:hypothetical protein
MLRGLVTFEGLFGPFEDAHESLQTPCEKKMTKRIYHAGFNLVEESRDQ